MLVDSMITLLRPLLYSF